MLDDEHASTLPLPKRREINEAFKIDRENGEVSETSGTSNQRPARDPRILSKNRRPGTAFRQSARSWSYPASWHRTSAALAEHKRFGCDQPGCVSRPGACQSGAGGLESLPSHARRVRRRRLRCVLCQTPSGWRCRAGAVARRPGARDRARNPAPCRRRPALIYDDTPLVWLSPAVKCLTITRFVIILTTKRVIVRGETYV